MALKKEFSLKLKPFVHILETIVDECKQTGRITGKNYQGEIQLAPRYVVEIKVKDINYEAGKISKLTTEKLAAFDRSWLSAEHIVEDCIVNSDDYIALINHAESLYVCVDARKILYIFTKKAIRILLEEDSVNEKLGKLITECLDSLDGKLSKYGAEGFIYGITLNTNEIQFYMHDIQISIRQLAREDFEFKGSVEDSIKLENEMGLSLRMPSAHLKIEFNDISGKDIFFKTQKILAVLRLFNIGSIDYSRMRAYSSSFVDEAFISLDGHNYKTSETQYISSIGLLQRAANSYEIGSKDLPILNRFLEKYYHIIPPNFYDSSLKKDYLSLSYDRYVNALLDSSSPEYRIATTVMGLESIYLTENMELKYRLGVRAARVLGILSDTNNNLSPSNVRGSIGLSYDIRSAFVHGDEPDRSLLKKIKNQYSNTNSLLLTTLNYLRASIALCLVLSLSKKDFISQIDDSLIDEKSLASLKEKMASVKDLIFV